MRKMAEVVKIDDIVEHPNADQLEFCIIEGWRCIARKGEFENGQEVVFIQPDAWVPHDLAPFLSKGQEPKVYNEILGNRVRMIRLRGEYSQGLIFPLSVLNCDNNVSLGDDVSEILGIVKYDPPIPAQLQGKMKGNFPSWGRKTDQERIQSCFNRLKDQIYSDTWEVTEKMEGSSLSCGKFHDEIVVCSREISLNIEDEENRQKNTFVRTAIELNLIEGLQKLGRNMMISGELIGPGIQGNIYDLTKHEWRVFDVLDCDTRKYLSTKERVDVILALEDVCGHSINHVPVINQVAFFVGNEDVEFFVNMADGKSLLNSKRMREGLVFKNQRDPDISFKAISRKYLMKQEENNG